MFGRRIISALVAVGVAGVSGQTARAETPDVVLVQIGLEPDRVDDLGAALVELGHSAPAAALREALIGPLPPASATAALDSSRAMRKRAFNAYAAFKVKPALEAIDGAEAAAVSALPDSRALAALAELALLRAQVRLQANQRDRAAADLRTAHRLRAGAPLDPGLYGPDVIALYDGALKGEARAVLEIDADPNVVAAVDGNRVGKRVELGVGHHYAVFARPGFVTERRVVEVEAGGSRATVVLRAMSTTELAVAMRRRLGDVGPTLESLDRLATALGASRLLVATRTRRGAVIRLFRRPGTLGDERPATRASVRALLAPQLDPGVVVVDRGTSGVVKKRSWLSRNRTPVLIVGGVVGGSALLVAGILTTVALVGGGDGGNSIDRFCGLGVPCD